MRHLEGLSFESLFARTRARHSAEGFTAELFGESAEDASVDEATPTVVVVGQKITLDVRSLFPLATVESIEWTIPGTSVGGYELGPTRAKVTPVDAKKNPLTFFWLDGGDGRVVTCNVVMKVVGSRIETVLPFAFDVKAPELQRLRGTTDMPQIVPERTTAGPRHRLSFGKKRGTPGIQWEWRVKLPSTHGGRVMDLQLVKLGRRKTRRASTSVPNETMVQRAGGVDQYVLDVGNEDCPATQARYHQEISGAAGAVVETDLPFDTPSDRLERVDWAYEVDEHFKYFLLFKPDVPDAIWVPVAMSKWYWCAAAQKYDGVWRLRPTPTPHGQASRGKATTELPRYSTNTCDARWCTVDDTGVVHC
jgi:hypothetical protein